MIFRHKPRQYGNFSLPDEKDLPPEDIISGYSFFSDLKNNPVYYLRKHGYIRKGVPGKKSFARFLLLSLSIIMPFFAVPAIIFSWIVYAIVLYLFKTASNIFNIPEMNPGKYNSRLLYTLLGVKDSSKFIDIAMTNIQARDYITAIIAEKLSPGRFRAERIILILSSIFAMILIVVFDFKFIFLYFPFYFFCFKVVLNKKHSHLLKNEIRKVESYIDKIERASTQYSEFFYFTGILLLVSILELIFSRFIFILISFLTDFFASIYLLSDRGFYFFLSFSILIYTLIYPLIIIYRFIRYSHIKNEEDEINAMTGELSKLITYTVYYINDSSNAKMEDESGIRISKEIRGM